MRRNKLLCLCILCFLTVLLLTFVACRKAPQGSDIPTEGATTTTPPDADTNEENTEMTKQETVQVTETAAATAADSVPVTDIRLATDTQEETTVPESETVTEIATEPATETPTQPEPETETETEIQTEPATEKPVLIAGENSGLERDGTPKKYITLSFDDGITQDLQIIEILKKYNVDCCTFNINTGLYGANWAWVGQQFNRPDVTHLRFTKKQLLEGIYDGFDVEVHTLSHPSLKSCADSRVKSEVGRDAQNIAAITGISPVGMAWPGGDTEYNEQNIKVILENTDIRFARGITATYQFKLPEYFMTWQPTCSISDSNVLQLAQNFIDAECSEDMLFYVWGHGYELDLFDTWGRFETLVSMIADAAANDQQIVLVTNAEFYQLFKNEIPSWKEESPHM